MRTVELPGTAPQRRDESRVEVITVIDMTVPRTTQGPELGVLSGPSFRTPDRGKMTPPLA